MFTRFFFAMCPMIHLERQYCWVASSQRSDSGKILSKTRGMSSLIAHEKRVKTKWIPPFKKADWNLSWWELAVLKSCFLVFINTFRVKRRKEIRRQSIPASHTNTHMLFTGGRVSSESNWMSLQREQQINTQPFLSLLSSVTLHYLIVVSRYVAHIPLSGQVSPRRNMLIWRQSAKTMPHLPQLVGFLWNRCLRK